MKKSLKFFLLLVILTVIAVPVCNYNSIYANMIAPPERMIKYNGDFKDDDQAKVKQEASEKQKPQLKNKEVKSEVKEEQQIPEPESKKQKNKK